MAEQDCDNPGITRRVTQARQNQLFKSLGNCQEWSPKPIDVAFSRKELVVCFPCALESLEKRCSPWMIFGLLGKLSEAP